MTKTTALTDAALTRVLAYVHVGLCAALGVVLSAADPAVPVWAGALAFGLVGLWTWAMKQSDLALIRAHTLPPYDGKKVTEMRSIGWK